MLTDDLTDQQTDSNPTGNARHANSEGEAIRVLLRGAVVRLRNPTRLRDAGLTKACERS